MRFALLIILITFALAIIFAVAQLLFRFPQGGDIGGRFSAGPDGGVYRSTDGGVTFAQSSRVDEKIHFSRFDALDLQEDRFSPGQWWVATEGQGVFRSRNQGESWETVWGDGELLRQAVVRALAQASETTWLFALDADRRGRIWKTSDTGATFREVFSTAKDNVTVKTLAIPRQSPAVVFAGLSDGLLIGSTDGGESWTSLQQFSGAVNAITIAPSDPQTIFAIIERFGVLVSKNQGKTWAEPGSTPKTDTIVRYDQPSLGAQRSNLSSFSGSRQIFSVAVHPQNAGSMLFASASGLLRSEDNGLNFVQLPVPLKPQALPLRAVAFDPAILSTIHVTAGDGFYTSFDNGQNWRVTRFTVAPKLSRIGISTIDRNIILIGTGE